LIKVVVAIPPKELSPNRRTHWKGRLRPKQQYRWSCYLRTKEALGRRQPPQWETSYVRIKYYSRTSHKQARDNIIASLKPAFDGIEDARVVETDEGMNFVSVERLKDASDPRVEIYISDKYEIERKENGKDQDQEEASI
jgi:crossover junction endodeoxyribonuclease RusA